MARRSRKGFDYGKGKYYITIKSIPNNITMNRSDVKAAADVYHRYVQLGKEVEWHGKWNGKNWDENTPPKPNHD